MNSRFIKVFVFLLCFGLLAQPVAAARITHGTADYEITEDMINHTPPADYAVDPATQGKAQAGKYKDYFPKDSLQTVSIEIDENNLNYLLQNADKEPYVMTDSVTVGDTTLGYCGLRTKGNYTLAHAYTDNRGSDRFSFTVNFGKYIKKDAYGQTQNFYGCEKISFNNFFFDKSMMKEYFAFKLFDEMGLPTPEYALAKLYINGEYYGVYFMVESMDTSILEQHWNVSKDDLSSYLCKPTGTNLLYGQIEKDPAPLYEHDGDKLADVEDMLPTAIDWVRRLNCLSSGTDFGGNAIDVNSPEYLELLAQVMDIDETVRYFATHSWLCQMDNMFTTRQNFALYISPEGISTLLPWDYDLAFGCYAPGTAENTANYPVDAMYQLDESLYSQVSTSAARVYGNYPLFHVIFQNESLMELYHRYMLDCSRIAVLGGTVEATGKRYAPGYFHSAIEAIEEELTAAAREQLADNVYYMNFIRQPSDIQAALPNLSKIIALRGLGVWSQIAGEKIKVSSSGCNLESLGNAMRGDSSTEGRLMVINPATGIFVSNTYTGTRRGAAVNLAVSAVAEDTAVYPQIAEAVSLGWAQELTVYQLVHTGNVSSKFTLTVPLSPEDAEREPVFYSYVGGELTRLEMTRQDNLFTATSDSLSYLVIVTQRDLDWVWPVTVSIGIAGMILVGLVLIRPKKEEV